MTNPVEKHFDRVAANYDYGKSRYSYYYSNLKKLLGSLIPEGKKVFEIGCGTGNLLNHLQPQIGYGFDISQEMISISNYKFKNSKNLTFSTKWPEEKFDYIFMSDVVEHLENPRETFRKIPSLMDRGTIFICTMANPIWEPLLMFWERMGWKMPEGPHRRITNYEFKILIEEAGMKVIKHDYRLLIPVKIPLITNFANKYLEKYFKKLAFISHFKRFSFIEYFVAVKS